MDVKTAFLNGNLLEDVYMTQSEGFVQPKNSGKVCKLQRSIYGLKQASRSWNLQFDESVKGFGFVKNEDEPCVYRKLVGVQLYFWSYMLMTFYSMGMISLPCRMSSLG